jgi:hypothetical protein
VARLPEFPCVLHPQFGSGIVLGEREIGIGTVKDVFFLDGERVRAVLPEFLEATARPDVGPGALRSAWSTYKKMYRIKKAEPVEPEPVRDLDAASWRRTPPEFEGNEEALIAAD